MPPCGGATPQPPPEASGVSDRKPDELAARYSVLLLLTRGTIFQVNVTRCAIAPECWSRRCP